jgi:NDP-sugar pyrophosphorylase family protein
VIPALVLTAGLATRLRPLSFVRAKAAVPVAGRPLVVHVLERLRRAGVTDVVLNLHHLPHTITSRLGDGTALGLRVRYSWEITVLGSAGGPARAAPLIGTSPFLVVNGDTLADIDLPALVAHHRASRALVTLAVTPNRDPGKYRGVAADDQGTVTGFVEKGDESPSWHFVGVQVIDIEALRHVSPDAPSETTTALYPSLIAERPGSVQAFRTSGTFQDIGTPADYLATCLALSPTQEPSGATSRSHASVVDSVLWDDVVLEPGTALTRSVVTDGVRVPAGTSWTNCTIRLAATGPLQPGEAQVGNLAIGPIESAPTARVA